MSRRFASLFRAVALIGIAVSLSACVVAPYGGGYRHHGGGYGGYRTAPHHYAQSTYGRGSPNWGGGGYQQRAYWR